jgi:hypothetical protein
MLMLWSRLFVAVPLVPLAVALAGACGGKVDGSGGGADAGTDVVVFTEPDGARCVSLPLSTFDRSCASSSDCISISTGTICTDSCACGGSAVNASGEARYQAAISELDLRACPCVALGQPACVGGMCMMCGFDSDDPACNDGGVTVSDGGADAKACVDISLSDYDTSCTTASDCFGIQVGKVCSGSCECGGTLVNVSGQAKYEAAVSGIEFSECPCPSAGEPACLHGVCAYCGGGSMTSPDCPDGG